MSMQSGAAYNYSAYELPQQQKKPELKVVRNKRARSASTILSMRSVSAFAIVVTLISLMVYNQVQINEVSGEINSLTKQLDELESENTRMMSELEVTQSLRTIEEQAKYDLGMNRLDKYQTVYICLEQEDRIELTENSPKLSPLDKFEQTIKSAIGRLQEYMEQD